MDYHSLTKTNNKISEPQKHYVEGKQPKTKETFYGFIIYIIWTSKIYSGGRTAIA